MLHRLLFSAALVAFASILYGKDLPAPSTIRSVKVFLSGAEVTRTAKVSIPAGASTLVFSKLSVEIDPANIQVNGQGAFTILGVRHRLNNGEADDNKKPELKEIEARIKSQEAEMARESALAELLVKEEARLAKNDLFGGDKGVSMAELQRMNEYMQQRIEAVTMGLLTKRARIQELNEELTALRHKHAEVNGRRPVTTGEVFVDVSCTVAVEARLTLKYVVRSAGWTPSYDIRVQDISHPLELVYKALVFQSSGEDWSEVALGLSSGEPKKGAVMPLMSSWLLDFGQPHTAYVAPPPYQPGVRDVRGFVRDERTGEALPFVTITLVDAQGNTLNGATSDLEGYYAIAIPENGKELRFNYMGYKSQGTPVSAGVINQGLAPDAVELRAVEVTAEKRSSADRVSVQRLSPQQIQRVPAIGGQTDLAQSLQVMPGVVFSGGRTTDASYYVDGVKVATGGIPANYGDVSGGLAERATRRSVNFEFAIDVPYSIPSDGQSHTVAIRTERLNSDYRHYCTPKLDLDAFLFAKVTGWDTLNLLPGTAQIYFEGTYVGESHLDPSTTADTLDLSLGRDKGISVQRTKRKDFSQKQTVGGKRIDNVSWELAVRNNKAEAVRLIITDQFPVAVRSEIEVELEESSGAQVNEEKGFLTWKKSLEPRSNQSWSFSYSVKYPKEALVVLE